MHAPRSAQGGIFSTVRVTVPAFILSIGFARPIAAQGGVSENTAFHLSLWSTVVPVAAGAAYWLSQKNPVPNDPFYEPDRSAPSLIMAGGFVFGPVVGYEAAKLSGRGWKGAGLRAGVTLLSFFPAFAICGWDCSKGDESYDLAWVVVATGSGLSAAHAVYDIARVKHNVRRHRGIAPTSEPGFSITPTYAPGKSAGVLVHVSF